MGRAYFGSRISQNLIETPEGYLICKNVPLARTGTQQYLGAEFGGEEPDREYTVNRPEGEVFSAAAIASFEGKPVVDEHPDEDVNAGNYEQYLKGVCRDVRHGEGDFNNCIVGDLVIYDEDLINKIKNGKREISCGYDCLWVPTSDTSYEQREIRGNHIAVVDKGRAGHKVAIRDQAERRNVPMKSNLFARMLQVFAKDSGTTPDDLLAASALAGQDEAPAAPVAAPVEQPVAAPGIDAELDARLKKIEDALAALQPQQAAPAPAACEPPVEDGLGCEGEAEQEELDALDGLEAELNAAPVEGEAAVQADPDVINSEMDVQDEAGEFDPLPEAEAEEEPVAPAAVDAACRDSALKAINNLRPVIASLPKAQRKAAADSLAMLIRGHIGRDAQYAGLQRAQAVRPETNAMDDAAYGKMIRDKFNPHYKK